MSKLATIIALALLLSFSLISATRPNVGLNIVSSTHKDDSAVDSKEVSCEGVKEEQECLTRRTLEAHLDYIYTNASYPYTDPKN
ncbi:unnamed protein product [Lathyrus oleraceus]